MNANVITFSHPRILKTPTAVMLLGFFLSSIYIDRFKVVADKDMRKMSNIVENLIRRYVESRW